MEMNIISGDDDQLSPSPHEIRETAPSASHPEAMGSMTAVTFRLWRKRMGWRQQEAAARLGLSKRIIQYYEKGNRDGQEVQIPLSVRLACYALSRGVQDYDGQTATPLDIIPPRSAIRPLGDETGIFS